MLITVADTEGFRVFTELPLFDRESILGGVEFVPYLWHNLIENTFHAQNRKVPFTTLRMRKLGKSGRVVLITSREEVLVQMVAKWESKFMATGY